jgi:hypothetical protein
VVGLKRARSSGLGTASKISGRRRRSRRDRTRADGEVGDGWDTRSRRGEKSTLNGRSSDYARRSRRVNRGPQRECSGLRSRMGINFQPQVGWIDTFVATPDSRRRPSAPQIASMSARGTLHRYLHEGGNASTCRRPADRIGACELRQSRAQAAPLSRRHQRHSPESPPGVRKKRERSGRPQLVTRRMRRAQVRRRNRRLRSTKGNSVARVDSRARDGKGRNVKWYDAGEVHSPTTGNCITEGHITSC